MLAAIGAIATEQSDPTKNTIRNAHQFLDYAATHPDTIITFHDSGIALAGRSDASYLS